MRTPTTRKTLRKNRGAAAPNDVLASAWDWLSNESNRGTLLGGCTLFGSVMIAVHYLWLGLTPAFDLGQATLLVLQAFIVGVALTAYFALVLLSPAFAYRFCSMTLSADTALRRNQFKQLALRSLGMQLFAGSALLLVLMKFPDASLERVFWGGVLLLGVVGLAIILAIPTLQLDKGFESAGSFAKTCCAIGILTVPSLSMLLLLNVFPYPHERANDFFFFLAWLGVAMYASFLGLMDKKDFLISAFLAMFIFGITLLTLNAVRMPFAGTAYALGLAVRQPVDLVLPPEGCKQVKLVLNKGTHLACDGDDAGLLKGVWLMNTLGERWVLRQSPDGENVIFDGKGVTYKRSSSDKPASLEPASNEDSTLDIHR